MRALRGARLLAIVALVALMLAVAGCKAAEDAKLPDIEVRDGAGAVLMAGDTVDFGTRYYSGTRAPMNFTIRNLGDGTLTLTLPLTIGGADPTYYTVTASPAATVDAGSSTGFTVDFPTTSVSIDGTVFTADVTIDSDDPDQGSFTFGVTGVGNYS